jgi:hypothetical protein
MQSHQGLACIGGGSPEGRAPALAGLGLSIKRLDQSRRVQHAANLLRCTKPPVILTPNIHEPIRRRTYTLHPTQRHELSIAHTNICRTRLARNQIANRTADCDLWLRLCHETIHLTIASMIPQPNTTNQRYCDRYELDTGWSPFPMDNLEFERLGAHSA